MAGETRLVLLPITRRAARVYLPSGCALSVLVKKLSKPVACPVFTRLPSMGIKGLAS